MEAEADVRPGGRRQGGRRSGLAGALDRYFEVSARRSTFGREIRGGVATFFAMAYIVVLNPLIIGTVPDADHRLIGGAATPAAAIGWVAAATALVAGVVTILMGVVGKYPYALATGLGLNAFLAVALAPNMTWADAMGLVVIEGLVLVVLVLVGARRAVFQAIPGDLKVAIGVGIGLFVAMIGLVNAGFVRKPTGDGKLPVELGIGGNLAGWPTLVFVCGLALTAILVVRRVRGGILISIATTTVLAIIIEAVAKIGPSAGDGAAPNPKGWQLVVPALPDRLFQLPDLRLVGDFNLLGSWERVGVVTALLLVFTLMLSDFFDSMGTVVGVGRQGGLVTADGELPGADRVLLIDSIGAAAGGAGSVSSATVYAESATGVGEGARTGLASVVCGLLFLLAMFCTPLTSIVPFEAATPALVVVGFLMMTQIRDIDWSDYGIGIPAFLTIVLMPFTYAITTGIGVGLIAYAVIRSAQGRWREVHPLLWVAAVLFAIYFCVVPIREILGIG